MKELLFTIILIAFIGCNEKSNDHQELIINPTATDISSNIMDAPVLTKAGNSGILSLQGTVGVPPNQHVSIQPYFEGYVADLQVIEGSEVQKGDLLFRLINPSFIDIQKDYLVYKAQVEYLAKDLKRKQTLNDERITADLVLEEIAMNYAIAKANLTSTKMTLELMNVVIEDVKKGRFFQSINVYAPISGFVDDLALTSGEFVGKNKEVISIINLEQLHLDLKMFEKDLTHVAVGQKIKFRLPERSDEFYDATIYSIGKSIDKASRLIDMHAHLEGKNLGLVPGMFVEAQLVLESEEVAINK